MCSSPKGGTTKPYTSSVVESTFSDMSSSEYSDMVRRANENYERRQEELLELRKNRVSSQALKQENISRVSFFEKIKKIIMPLFLIQQIEKK